MTSLFPLAGRSSPEADPRNAKSRSTCERVGIARRGAANLPRLDRAGCLRLLSGAALIGILSLLSLGCGDKTTVSGGELQKRSDIGGLSAIAEAGDGTLLLEWVDRHDLESFAPPGKGWSRPVRLPDEDAYVNAVAFNGRGERLAIWGGATLDVRRPGDEKPLLRASLPSTLSGEFGGARAIGSSGCDFLLDRHDTSWNEEAFLVSCKPSWRVVPVRMTTTRGFSLVFDRSGRPAAFSRVNQPHGAELLFYATIRADGGLNPPRRVALLSEQEVGDAARVVQGAREPTIAWGANNGEIWQATPEGATRLAASRSPSVKDVPLGFDDFDAIADGEGRAIVAWNDSGGVWISLPTANGRRTEKVADGSRPVLARAGKQLFVNVDLGGQLAIFARSGSFWKESDLGENRWGAVKGASGSRAIFAWTHNNYTSDQVSSTDLYTWVFPSGSSDSSQHSAGTLSPPTSASTKAPLAPMSRPVRSSVSAAVENAVTYLPRVSARFVLSSSQPPERAVLETGQNRSNARSRSRPVSSRAFEKTVSTSSPSPCDSWFGPFVVALACDPKEAGKQGANSGTPGTFVIEAPAGIRTDSSPGIAQAVGSPLRPGSTLTVAGTAPDGTELALRVQPTGGTESDVLFDELGLEQGGRAVAKIQEGVGGVPAVTLSTPKGTFKSSRTFTTPRPPHILALKLLAHRLRVRFLAKAPKTILQIYSAKKLIYSRTVKTKANRRKTVLLKLSAKAKAKARFLIAVSVNPGGKDSTPVRRAVPRHK